MTNTVSSMYKAGVTPVVITRPERGLAHQTGSLIGGLLGVAIRAWLLMLLLPVTVLPIAPGFWTCAATILAFSMLFGLKDGHLGWTTNLKEKK